MFIEVTEEEHETIISALAYCAGDWTGGCPTIGGAEQVLRKLDPERPLPAAKRRVR